MIRRSFPSWMHEEEERAAYMPSIKTVKERSTVLDKYNTVKTKMAWIALKFPEEDWDRWLKQEARIDRISICLRSQKERRIVGMNLLRFQNNKEGQFLS